MLLPTTIASASVPAAGCVRGTGASWLLNVPGNLGTNPDTNLSQFFRGFLPPPSETTLKIHSPPVAPHDDDYRSLLTIKELNKEGISMLPTSRYVYPLSASH